MQPASCVFANLTAQLLFDKEKQILKTAVKLLICPRAVLVDLEKGSKNGCAVCRLQQALFSQHHPMRQVYRMKRC